MTLTSFPLVPFFPLNPLLWDSSSTSGLVILLPTSKLGVCCGGSRTFLPSRGTLPNPTTYLGVWEPSTLRLGTETVYQLENRGSLDVRFRKLIWARTSRVAPTSPLGTSTRRRAVREPVFVLGSESRLEKSRECRGLRTIKSSFGLSESLYFTEYTQESTVRPRPSTDVLDSDS